MKSRLFFVSLIFLCSILRLEAGELRIFELMNYEMEGNKSFAFISLSDVYPISEHPDSLPMPDLSNTKGEDWPTYLKLESKYRKTFLSRTKISEMDKVSVYDYSSDVLLSFTVKNLKVVACMSVYGIQGGYMIGFEIDKKFLSGFENYFTTILVAVGKENPFVQGQMKHITWKKLEPKDFFIPMNSKDSVEFMEYRSTAVKANVYGYKLDGLQYYVQDYVYQSEPRPCAKRLVVLEQKTRTILCERIFLTGEGSSFAPLDDQWTGKLFRNKPYVIFGFEYISFGCPGITVISNSQKDIGINCDNRH